MAEQKSPARSRKTTDGAVDASDESLIPEAPAGRVDAQPAETVDAIADAVIVPDEPEQPGSSEVPEEDARAATGNHPPVTEDAPEADVALPPPAEKVVERVIERRGSVFPMILAGAVVAVAGFVAGASDLLSLRDPPPDLSGDIAALEGRIVEVETGLASVVAPQAPDLSPLTARLDGAEATLSDLAARQTALDDRLATLDARITELAALPVTEGASQAAVAAFEAELDALRTAIATERAEVEEMLAAARETEANAAEQAQLAEAKAAIARLVAAIDRGDDLQAELAALGGLGVTVPEALAQAGDGVATLTALQVDFPDAARAALAAARATDGVGAGVGSWLERQLGARSVTPRDGDDPDAILSRAEAALTQGQIDVALQEIGALPDAAKAPLADWLAAAAARLAATQAVDAMAAELTSN